MTGPIVALAGGVGGAKLALGLAKVLPPDKLTIVVNTGDDEIFHGLHVSPDLDTMMYALAGLTNSETGWGVAEDSFNALDMLGRYGSPTWFNLGDKDLATHIRRTELLRQGWSLSKVTRELSQRLGIDHKIVPMSDDKVSTIVETEDGDLPFQVYFVERRCEPVLKGIRFEGAEKAKPAEDFVSALEEASALMFCPSNPFLSVAPILAIPGVRERIEAFSGPRLAVSPIIGGEALRGPAAKILSELGHEVSCLGVAKQYPGLCDIFMIDTADYSYTEAIETLGMRVQAASIVMAEYADQVRMAAYMCRLLEPSAKRSRKS